MAKEVFRSGLISSFYFEKLQNDVKNRPFYDTSNLRIYMTNLRIYMTNFSMTLTWYKRIILKHRKL